jgi:hypothetical protein
MNVIERGQHTAPGGSNRSLKHQIKTVEPRPLAEYLAALAGLAAALAALVGFIPGLYRDPPVVVAQSHGYDVGNLVVVLVLGLGLAWARRGSVRGRLIAVGALGCLFYSFVTYAFAIVLNPATLLYIAVLAGGGWSFVAGFAQVDDGEVETLVEGRLARRATAGFLAILALLFGATWLSQVAGSAISGKLPPELAASGWPMNPVYVLDLGFVLPLALLAAVRLLRHQPGGARLAVSFLVFDSLLAASILLMGLFAAVAAQPLQLPMIAIFAAILIVSSILGGRALIPRAAQIAGEARRDAIAVTSKRHHGGPP